MRELNNCSPGAEHVWEFTVMSNTDNNIPYVTINCILYILCAGYVGTLLAVPLSSVIPLQKCVA